MVALLALVALALSAASDLWASSVCVPEAEFRGGVAECAAGMIVTEADGSNEKRGHPEGAQCPMAPGAVAGACSAVPWVPSEAANLAGVYADGITRPFSPEEAHHLLLVTTLFRPPRA